MVANQERFMEILTGLFEFAQSNGDVLEKSKVEESFSEMRESAIFIFSSNSAVAISSSDR